jgi:threonine/homoserine/homoserine lactone efflux protein
MHDPVLFTIATLTILAMPGPTNILVATSGGTVGFRRSLRLIGGEVTGYLVSITLTGLFLRSLLVHAPSVSAVLRMLVGGYLLLLAVGLWHHKSMDRSATMPITLRQVFITTLLNPKAIVFALAIVPFGASNVWLYLAGLAGLITSVAVAWVAFGAFVAAAVDRRGYASLVPRLGAAAVAGFAATLMLGPYL